MSKVQQYNSIAIVNMQENEQITPLFAQETIYEEHFLESPTKQELKQSNDDHDTTTTIPKDHESNTTV